MPFIPRITGITNLNLVWRHHRIKRVETIPITLVVSHGRQISTRRIRSNSGFLLFFSNRTYKMKHCVSESFLSPSAAWSLIKNLLSNSLLGDEKRSRPKNSTRSFVYRYLNEEDIPDAQFFTETFPPPIHNRCLSYSCWTFSPFWKLPMSWYPLIGSSQ